MIVRYGTVVPRGWLPVYSVDTMAEARALLVAACPTNLNGEFVAPELAKEQTVERLLAFGERLAEVHARIRVNPSGRTHSDPA